MTLIKEREMKKSILFDQATQIVYFLDLTDEKQNSKQKYAEGSGRKSTNNVAHMLPWDFQTVVRRAQVQFFQTS